MKLKRLIAGVLSAAMLLSVSSTLAFANSVTVGDVVDDDTTYANASMTFDSVMYLSDDAISAPNVTYTYTLIAGAIGAYTSNETTTKIYAGVLTDITTSATAEFTTSDYATAEHTVTKEVTFDFSSLLTNVTEAGIYHYVITETIKDDDVTAATAAIIKNESDQTRNVYVYVEYELNTDGKTYDLVISQIIMTTDAIVGADDGEVTYDDDAETDGLTDQNKKSEGFNHSYGTSTDPNDPEEEPEDPDTFTSETFIVTDIAKGTMANRSKDFTFTLSATVIEAGSVLKYTDEDGGEGYLIMGSSGEFYIAEQSTDDETGVVSYDIATDGDGYNLTLNNFLMNSGESVTIYGVPETAVFTATITDPLADGYTFWDRDHDADFGGDAWSLTELVDSVYTRTYTIQDLDSIQGIDFATVKGADDTVDDDGDDLPEKNGDDPDDPDEGEETDDDKDIVYTDAYPETGVVLDLAPYAVMVLLAGAFIGFRVFKAARRDEE